MHRIVHFSPHLHPFYNSRKMSIARLSRATRALRSTHTQVVRPFSTSLYVRSPLPTPVASSSTTAVQPHPAPPSESYHPSTSSIFTPLDTFLPRHLGPKSKDVDEMLKTLGYASMDEFISATIPDNVRVDKLTSSGEEVRGIRPYSELELSRRVEEIAGMNKRVKSYIGMG